MGKKSVVFCDLTKQEVEEESSLVTITIKIPGKKNGRSYELSPEAAAKLEQQLTAGPDAKLDHDWQFDKSASGRPSWGVVPNETQKSTKLGDLDDDQFVADKKQELKERGELGQERPELENAILAPSLSASEKSDCLHMNKGSIQTTMRSGKRYAYRICRECRRQVTEKSKTDTQTYMAGKLPPDVNIRDLGDR